MQKSDLNKSNAERNAAVNKIWERIRNKSDVDDILFNSKVGG